MADRYDPKLSVRPLSERKPASPGAAGEDPLIELARIVSGRTTFDPGPAQRAKTVPVNGAVASDVALANDLESELLNDLQASFSSTFYAPPPPPPPPPPAAAQKPAAKPAAPPLAKPQPAPASPAAPSPAQAAAPAREPEKPIARPERSAPPAAARPEKPASSAPGKAERSVALPAPAERTSLARQPSISAEKPEKIDLPEAQLRSTAAAHPAPADAVPAKPAGRWERPAEPRAATPDPSRFAPPPRGGALFRPKGQPQEPEPEEDDLPDLAALGGGSTEEEGYEEEGLPPEDLDVLPPLYGEDDNELPPYPDELEELSGRRPRRGLFAGAALLAVVLAAGVAFIMLRSESSVATPPIIAADATPAKIVPPVTPGDNDEQNKLIYDRVEGAPGAEGTKLVTPGDEPVAESPTGSADANNPISRIIAPGGPGFDPPVKDGEPAADAAPGAETADASEANRTDGGPIPPKKVRTFVVGPDLTVISGQAGDAAGKPAVDSAGKAPAGPPAAAAAEPAPETTPGVPQMDAVVDSGKGLPIAVDADPLSAGGDKTASGGAAPADPAEPGSVPASDGDAAAGPPATADAGAPPAGDDAADAPVAAAEPTPAAKPPVEKPAAKPAVVAARSSPIDLTPAKGSKASSGLLVQVSAQKSEDAAKASYRDLQGKFPAILGSLNPNIQRADLGEKGIYYRVRVGPFAAADAQKLCGDIQAAGGTCLIAKH